jgi:FkbM family methyltransferase
MIAPVLHALGEGRQAAELAADARSARRLRADFILSRLLRFGRLPGYNVLRQVTMRSGLVVNYRLNRGDLQSLREVLVEEVYRCELPLIPKTILDLGANIGLASVWLSRLSQSERSRSSGIKPEMIVAIEPVPENAAVARLNFESNAIAGEVIQAAAGLVDREGWFEQRAESNLGQLGRPGSNPAADTENRIRVPVIGVASLLDRFPSGTVDLVKMDIEGGEAELLGGDVGWLRQVKMLMVEWHDELADSAPLIRNVEGAGFRHERINVGRQDNLGLLVKI